MQATINKCLLAGTVVISMAYIIASFRQRVKNTFASFLNIVSAFIALHASYMLIVAVCYRGETLINPPFALMYGPFLYSGFALIHRQTISLGRIALHVGLFVAFSISFVMLVIFEPPDLTLLYKDGLALASIFSFLWYSVQAMIYNTKPIDAQFRHHKLLLIATMIMMLFATIVLCTGIYNEMAGNHLVSESLPLKMMLHVCLLSCTLLIFFFQRFKLRTIPASVPETDGKYRNSILSEEKLKAYHARLEILMHQDLVFLDTELSLLKLAQLMRAPAHHITQVLSAQIKMSFYEYVNSFRVQNACRLLLEDKDSTLDVIAINSGFKSKVSFNRHFKLAVGCTPSEYRQVQHKGD